MNRQCALSRSIALRLQRGPLANVLLGGHKGGTHLDATHRRPVQMMYHLVNLAAIEVDFAFRLLVLHEVHPERQRGGKEWSARERQGERGC